MKSKRAEEAIERYRKKFTAGFVTKNEVETVKEYCRLFTEVVELAEQDAEEEVTYYRKELEESKRREELARKVIDDQRKKIEALKARAVEAFLMSCSCGRDICSYRAEGVGCTDYLRGHGCSQYSVFIQKLNEQ